MYYNLGAPICKLKITQSLPSVEVNLGKVGLLGYHLSFRSPNFFFLINEFGLTISKFEIGYEMNSVIANSKLKAV